MSHLDIYKDLFDNRDEAIIIFDNDFNVVYHNQNLLPKKGDFFLLPELIR